MSENHKQSVLITGGSGMIGKYLTSALLLEGYMVSHLSRGRDQFGNVRVFRWDPSKGTLDPKALSGIDHIVHLAGVNIGEMKWTSERKKEIISSRIDSAVLIYKTLKKNNLNIKSFITASGISYYGTLTSERIFNEADPPSDDFLGNVAREWENAADMFSNDYTRTVKIRTAVVLEKNDSALQKIIAPAKFGFLGKVGSGKQYMPWIHIKDIVGIYLKAIEDEQMSGAFNAVALQQVTHSEFMKTLADVLHKPLLPVPAFALKVAFGEMAGIVLEGSRISSDKIRNADYKFDFDDLHSALEDIFRT